MPRSHTPVSKFFESQRLKLHYVEWGNRDAPPLILVHGGRDHCRNWDWVARELCGDWRIIAPDLRGHGDSDWCPSGIYTYDAYMWDLLALIEHLHIDQATIIGHSLGGNIALRLAAAFPERLRRLVCIEGLGTSPGEVERSYSLPYSQRLREDALYRLSLPSRPTHRYSSLEQAVEHFHRRNPTLSRTQAEHLASHGLRRHGDGSLTWKFDDYSRKPSQPHASESELRQLIAQVSCPVLLPWGGRSFFPLAENQARIELFRDAEVKLYPTAGHWPHHDQLEQFLGDVKIFLSESRESHPSMTAW
ncbi:alpha/beta fold hydrolase [Pseudomonas aeruginosa]|uniref:alpha/beta fold hydrolase n=1 Tax=Pseudomonas aeruginosa TaxID=287 RepID=UPI0009A2D4FE|nr:alpha/beta hydrolase [Pseudomonas aeruginosa]